ncbi:SHOCT domain-containing protein [Pseudonocardia zijingensis]|jgi:putative membrane protein|uniref:SHOCT domain-containing protein n=1 Tax=Pseudonocardia zijingensis TaxID=153376 RepID=A0ABN1P4A9_9PSEU
MMNSVGIGLFWIWPLLVIVGVALLGYTIARTWGGGARTEHRDAARRVLDERFARGEIDEQEYHRRRSVLEDRLR